LRTGSVGPRAVATIINCSTSNYRLQPSFSSSPLTSSPRWPTVSSASTYFSSSAAARAPFTSSPSGWNQRRVSTHRPQIT
ncbi:hypothetical protein WN51_10871, partial [Melipona quadrifasciata]